jgi:hypothetical protein
VEKKAARLLVEAKDKSVHKSAEQLLTVESINANVNVMKENAVRALVILRD